jgi:Kef-type K+ transport system membrane component KefB/nucleotide-binding universal stress UspA family protein
MRFQALNEHQLLVFWVQLLVLVLAARGLGGLVRRVGQPAVIGELAAGVILGPSVLGLILPQAWDWLFPADLVLAGVMNGVGWLGVFFLLILAGFETDLGLIRRLGRAAAWVSMGSLLVPLGFGLALGWVMPERFLGRADDRLEFALLMGTALAISALPVAAKVLGELDLMRRNFGQLTLAAGMVNDVAGWVLLGVIASLVQSGGVAPGPLLVTLGGLLLFALVAFTVGQRAIDALLRDVRTHHGGVVGSLTVVLLVSLAGAAVAQAIGLEGVLGAFVAGILLGRSRFQDSEVYAYLEAITLAFFAPLFFARAGLRVELGLLADPTVLLWVVIVLAAASAAKFVGAAAGARFAGLATREGWALGAGLNARGAVEVVIASVGLSLGVLSSASYTVVVLLAIVTSMMAPVLLRLIVRDWHGSPEEQERLGREKMLAQNALVRGERLLLPSHGGPNSILAAHILGHAWPDDVEATVLSVGDVDAAQVAPVLAAFGDRVVEHTHVPGATALEAIVAQARLGYGAIGVGATDQKVAGRLVSPVVDELLGASPLPVVMVRRGTGANGSMPQFQRILVPAIGTVAGRAAQEVAFSLARRMDADVLLVHVLTTPRSSVLPSLWPFRRREDEAPDARVEVGTAVLAEAEARAREMGVRVQPMLRTGVSVAEELLALAREADVDLMVVTASLRQLSGRPFLGHGVEHLLEEAESTLVMVATPPGWGGSRT